MEDPGRKRKPNRLIDEKSPYLLKHAFNPVDWHPWGDEAFEKARREDKPVFLSVGYSTCHWCNVMEEESFADQEAASLINEVFVPVKVDREERPDIDNLYMSVCLMLTGSGGWPLTVIMTPDKKPFYAGTYFPKESRFGRIGLMELIPRIRKVWEEQRDEVLNSAGQITDNLSRQSEAAPGKGVVDAALLDAAFEALRESFDQEYGGFGTEPKFPTPHVLSFLLRYWKRSGEGEALDMVKGTLRAMRRGGVFDHLGFGFHRYSTDRRWLVPHFEKMLYDQALLGIAYSEAYQATREEDFARTARMVFTYVLRDLTDPGGQFYSAESADSEGEEGKFYVWTAGEMRRVLDKTQAGAASAYYGVEEEGNFTDPLKGGKTGENILHMAKVPAEAAAGLGMGEREFDELMEKARGRLFDVRNKRIRPDTDDKVLTDWNGLMIAALSIGARALGEPGYSDAAVLAADFVLEKMRAPDGRLIHRWRLGEASIEGQADDYAFMVWGLLELYEAVFEPRYLKAALELNAIFIEDFWDPESGGFFFTGQRGERMLVRQKTIYDAAVPSANSVAFLNLLRLGAMTANPEILGLASKLGKAFSGTVGESPSAYAQFLCAADFALGPSAEVVVVGDPKAPDTEAMLEALRGAFAPSKVVLFRPTTEEKAGIDEISGLCWHTGPRSSPFPLGP
ncbi:MAG: thioredoxin domain-containing protein [Nitrospirota bacterium]